MQGAKRVLIVEDDKESQVFLSAILENNGYQYQVAGDGKEALEALQASHADLVLLDIMMPRKSGLSVLREMKKQPELQKIPVIIITGTSRVTGVDIKTGEEEPKESDGDIVGRAFGAAIRERLAGLTPDGLIEKPVDPPLLIEKIKELLS